MRPTSATRRVGPGTLASLAALVVGGAAFAQTEDEIERNRRLLEEGPHQAPVLQSEGPAPVEEAPGAGAPAIGPESYQVPVASLVREGAYLRDRRARLIDVEGSWIVVFDPDAQGDSEPPMILHPCMRTMEMARLASSSSSPSPTFVVSGRVFAYRARNFLLPERFVVVDFNAAREDRPERSEPSEDSDAPSPDPRVDELLEEMRAGSPMRSGRSRPGGTETGSAELNDERALVRDGSMIANQIGRIVSGGRGYWTFVSDGGVESGGPPPMRLLPSMNLMGIERVLHETGDRVRFSLSGQVYAHEGVNYLLVTVYRLELDREGNTVAAH